MTTLTITPVGTEPGVALEISAGTPAAAPNLQPVLDALAALPIPEHVDLTPVMAALASVLAAITDIPTPAPPDLAPVLAALAALPVPEHVDLAPVLAALASVQASIAAIPTPAPTDLTPVLEALAALPAPDISAAVAPLSRATDVANGFNTVLAKLDALPAPDVDLSPVLSKLDALPAPDVAGALATYAAAKKADVDANKTALTALANTNKADILAAIAAASGGPAPGEVKTFALDAAGKVPAGYAQINGPGSMPVVMGGLLAYLGNSKGGPYVNTNCSNVVVRSTGDAMWINGGTLYGWNSANGYGPNSMPAHPGNPIPSLAFLPSGRLLSAGSYLNNGPSTTCYAGNFGSLTWNQVASLTTARGYSSLVALKDGRVACIGGSNNNYYSISAANLLATVETYNETTNTWTTGTPAPVRGMGQAVLLPSGLVLWIPTNYSADGATLVANTNRAWLYNPVDSSWVETDLLPAGVTLATSSVLVADDAGALLVGLTGTPGAACRYTDGNVAGTRWTSLKLETLTLQASTGHGGFGVKLPDGQVFIPLSGGAPLMVNVQYNAGNQLVQARKL